MLIALILGCGNKELALSVNLELDLDGKKVEPMKPMLRTWFENLLYNYGCRHWTVTYMYLMSGSSLVLVYLPWHRHLRNRILCNNCMTIYTIFCYIEVIMFLEPLLNCSVIWHRNQGSFLIYIMVIINAQFSLQTINSSVFSNLESW